MRNQPISKEIHYNDIIDNGNKYQYNENDDDEEEDGCGNQPISKEFH